VLRGLLCARPDLPAAAPEQRTAGVTRVRRPRLRPGKATASRGRYPRRLDQVVTGTRGAREPLPPGHVGDNERECLKHDHGGRARPAPAPARIPGGRRWRSPGACASTASTCPTRSSPRTGSTSSARPACARTTRLTAALQACPSGYPARRQARPGTREGWQVSTPGTPTCPRAAALIADGLGSSPPAARAAGRVGLVEPRRAARGRVRRPVAAPADSKSA
jgi:hypothetical protein